MTTSKQQNVSKASASATVILLRDTPTEIEVLLVQKNHNINFGGSWVFPGGMVEEVDIQQSNLDSIDTARYAACRETKEETSIRLTAEELNPLSRWVTPVELAKRYSTWFFITDVNKLEQNVNIDNQEIVDAKWLSPHQALALQAEQKLQLNPPSFVSLFGLSQFNNTADAIAFYKDKQVHEYLPRGIKTDNGFIALYQEDCGYALDARQALSANGPKHRTLMHKSQAWEYICEMPLG